MQETETESVDTPRVETAEVVSWRLGLEYDRGFHVRNVEGPRPILNWQAGILVNEMRSYRDPSMSYPFHANVSLFLLLGYGYTREAALAMAQVNAKGRNGQ